MVNSTLQQGPSDGGGGDTCNGKLIESYKVDISQLDEFKEFILPVFNKLESGSRETKFNNPFMLTPYLKNWYIIDCKLQDIPKERKGLFLESYQTAIHTTREVFIDSSSYNNMVKEEKAKLLLHEIIMGYYLTKYLSFEQICKMANSCTDDVLKVKSWKLFRPETYRPLNDEDHQKIRNVTAWLWSHRDEVNQNELVTLLKNNDFDKRFVLIDDSDKSSKEIDVSPDVILRMFKKHQWSKTFPQYCQFSESTNVSTSKCNVEALAEYKTVSLAANHSMKYLSVSVKVSRGKDNKVFEQEFLYPLMAGSEKIKIHVNKFGNVLNAAPLMMMGNWPTSPGVEIKEGTRSQVLFLLLNIVDPENPEILQLQYQTYVWYSIEEEIVYRDGYKFKETYGYLSPLPEESELVFLENELQFPLVFNMKDKTYIKSERL